MVFPSNSDVGQANSDIGEARLAGNPAVKVDNTFLHSREFYIRPTTRHLADTGDAVESATWVDGACSSLIGENCVSRKRIVMSKFLPWKIEHVALRKPLPPLSSEAGCSGLFIVF